MGWPRLVLAHVVRVGLVVNGTEHQARLVTCRGQSHTELQGDQHSPDELSSQAPFRTRSIANPE